MLVAWERDAWVWSLDVFFNEVPLNVFYAFQGRKAGLGDTKMGLKWITSNVERLVMTH